MPANASVRRSSKRDVYVWEKTPELACLLWVCAQRRGDSADATPIPRDVASNIRDCLGVTCTHRTTAVHTETRSDMWRSAKVCVLCHVETELIDEGPFFC